MRGYIITLAPRSYESSQEEQDEYVILGSVIIKGDTRYVCRLLSKKTEARTIHLIDPREVSSIITEGEYKREIRKKELALERAEEAERQKYLSKM